MREKIAQQERIFVGGLIGLRVGAPVGEKVGALKNADLDVRIADGNREQSGFHANYYTTTSPIPFSEGWAMHVYAG